jgi:hypothetical protein
VKRFKQFQFFVVVGDLYKEKPKANKTKDGVCVLLLLHILTINNSFNDIGDDV